MSQACDWGHCIVHCHLGHFKRDAHGLMCTHTHSLSLTNIYTCNPAGLLQESLGPFGPEVSPECPRKWGVSEGKCPTGCPQGPSGPGDTPLDTPSDTGTLLAGRRDCKSTPIEKHCATNMLCNPPMMASISVTQPPLLSLKSTAIHM